MSGRPPGLLIRHETPSDIPSVRHVNEAAFGRRDEAALVDRLRENARFVLSLLAELNGEGVGHILFTDVRLEDADKDPRFLGLAPMAVLPAHQRAGIGAALITRGLEDCAELGYRGVVVLGHPEYYPRFGFVRADSLGIECQFAGTEDAFFARALGNWPLPAGRAIYAPEFSDL